MIRIYTASKLHHWKMWRKLCDSTAHIFAHARWLKHVAIGTPDNADSALQFWIEDQEDVRTADAVVIYGEGDDKLRGSLVEVGMAIAYGVPVIVVGAHPDYGTWQYHFGVKRVATMDDAMAYLKTLDA